MKCDKYKQLLEKFENSCISANETEALKLHTHECAVCNQEYFSIKRLKTIGNRLRQIYPVLTDKETLIDNILDLIPEKETNENKFDNKSFVLFPYKLRIAITSIAASLILFFIIQQTYDAYCIKQLENKFSFQKKSVNYSLVKANFVINQIIKKDKPGFTGIFSKVRKALINETFAMFNNEYSLVSKNEIKNLSDSDFVFYVDSTNHP